MRKLFILLWGVVIMQNSLFAQNWLWAKNFAGTSSQDGLFVEVLPNENIYCFAEYEPAGTVITGNTIISSIGHYNSFVAQFDDAGNFITITNLQSTSVDPMFAGGYTVGFGSPASPDNGGYFYITVGNQDNGLIDTIQVTGPANLYKSALSKWNAENRCLWLKYFPGTQLFPKFSVNNIYLTGVYKQPIIQIDSFQLSDPANKQQMYVAKADTNGKCKWLKQATGGNIDYRGFWGVNNNYLYVSATTDSCFNYDNLNICNSGGGSLGVLMKLDSNGAVVWSKAQRTEGPYYSPGKIAIIKGGGIYVLGSFDTTYYLGNDTLLKLGNESVDIFIAKLNELGNLVGLIQIPVTGISPSGISTDSLGYFYMTGTFSGTQVFGNYTVTAQSARDMFVTRYNPTGLCMGVVTVPNAQAFDITQDSTGNAIVTGAISATAHFGAITLIDTTTFFGNYIDEFFVAKLSAITGTSNALPRMLQEESLEIYANPSRGMFTIVVPQSLNNAGSGQLQIYDNSGAEVKNELVDISGNKIQVDLGTVQKGLYTVTLTSGRQFTGRVVIQ